MNYERIKEKRAAVKDAETKSLVADSMTVRMALLARVDSGEITLEQAQAELKKIKARAKRNGQATRSQIWASS